MYQVVWQCMVVVGLIVGIVSAQEMTTADYLQWRTDITVTRAAVVYTGKTILQHWDEGNTADLANYYNTEASPADPLWRPDIRSEEMLRGLVMSEYLAGTAGADVARRAGVGLLLDRALINATDPNTRTQFAAVSSGTTLTNWTAIARKNATNLEQVFAGAAVAGAKVTTKYRYRATPTDISIMKGLP